jgi:DNA-binding IclR family transcriptional regulator
MPRRAPAVERSIAVLNLLAAHPGERYTLSEIARDLRLNKATLHAILWALTEAGYLVRDPEGKSYGLGPALVAVGTAALSSFSSAEVARPEMDALAEELGLDCIASTVIHGEIVILARAGTPRPFGIVLQPGQRLPLIPPLGAVFVAWSGPEEIETWLGRLGPISVETRERFRDAIGAVRERGYSVGLEGDAHLLQALRGEGETVEEAVKGLRREEYALIDLDRKATYRLNHVGAPVFGPDGRVALGLFLIGFQGRVPGKDVEVAADRLATAASAVTGAIHGREPDEIAGGRPAVRP